MSAAHVDRAHHEAPASRWRERLRRLAIIVLVVVLIGAAANLFGWDLSGWFEDLWNTITKISIGYLLAGIALITLQTTTTAYAWYSILRFAYGRVAVRWMQVYACYATAVALNFVLPANLGTFVMLLMFLATIAGATFAGVIAGYVVQKVFYTAIGVGTWLYLFLSLGDTFKPAVRLHRRTPRLRRDHPGRRRGPDRARRTAPEGPHREVVGAGQGGRARSSPTHAPTWSGCWRRRCSAGWRWWGRSRSSSPPMTSPSASTR